jgi:hypothetical protein
MAQVCEALDIAGLAKKIIDCLQGACGAPYVVLSA